MPVPAWLQAMTTSQAGTPANTPTTRNRASGNTSGISRSGGGTGVTNPEEMQQARNLLMTGSPQDPAVWKAYEMVYGRPHTNSPEGQAAGDPATAALANSQTYTGFQDGPAANFFPGRETVDRAASIEGVNMQELVDNPAANQSLQFGAQGNYQDAIGQSFNDNQYASPETAQWLAKQLGGEYIAAEDYDGGLAGTIPGAAYIKMPNGEMMNAGLVGQQFKRIQDEYQMQLRNYEQNLSQNPNIIGTGFLSKPGDPIDMLKNKLAGKPYGNTNDAGGNQGIYDSLAQNQNAYGDPFGAGGPNADYPNSPPGPNNIIDQSTQPGDQTNVPPAGDPFAPQGNQPGAGPGGNQNPGPGYSNWTGQQGGYTPNPGTSMGFQGGNQSGAGGGNPGSAFGAGNPGVFGPGAGMPGTGGGGGADNNNPYQYQNPQQAFNPVSMHGQIQQQGGNPWDAVGQQGGGMQSLGQLLTGVQQLRDAGYGMQGGWNPATGFGGAIGTPGGGGQSGMMSYFQNRPEALPGGSLNSNYYNLS